MAKLLKDAYYFPHFYNARHDRKIKRIRKDLGIEGYGIFFMLLEVLREQTDLKYPFADVDLLSEEFGTSTAKIEAVIKLYDLFAIDEKQMFFSTNLMVYLEPYLQKSEKARAAINKRWDNYRLNLLNKSNTNVYTKNENVDTNVYTKNERVDTNVYSKNENEDTSKVKYSKVELLEVSSKVTPEKFYNDNFSPITPFIAEQIQNYIENDGIQESMITAVMEMSVINNKKSWNYVKSVVEDKISNGIKTLEQFQTHEKYRKDEKTNNNSNGLYREVD
jgi:DnaD/phage-associated family protein